METLADSYCSNVRMGNCIVQGHEQEVLDFVCLDQLCSNKNLCCEKCLEKHQKHQQKIISFSEKKPQILLKYIQHCDKQSKASKLRFQLQQILQKPKLIIDRFDAFKKEVWRGYLKRLWRLLSGTFDNDTIEKIAYQLKVSNKTQSVISQIIDDLKLLDLPQITNIKIMQDCLNILRYNTQQVIQKATVSIINSLDQIEDILTQNDFFEMKNIEELSKTVTQFQDIGVSKRYTADYKIQQKKIIQLYQSNKERWSHAVQDVPKKQQCFLVALGIFNKEKQVKRNLDALKFFSSKITYYEIKVMSQCQHLWSKIKKINLGNNNIGQKGVRQLVSHPWPSLNTLQLNQNNIKAGGVQSLASRQWPNLIALNISKNDIGSEGVHYLIKNKWPQLNKLNIGWNYIGWQGIKFLVSHPWQQLTALDLDNNNIGSVGAQYLLTHQWPSLKDLSIYNNNIDSQSKRNITRFFAPRI